ncbi:MAG: T6SS phospholipase effector Tle1-like catalytic domain-containing protein [Cupriavidus necator]
MSVLRWPKKMQETESGRLPEGPDAYGLGFGKVADPLCSCERTLHISLFFDGTNNNDDIKNPWRDAKDQSHTNVARLFTAAIDRHEQGTFAYYIAGVGTPFPELGEDTYSTSGKSFAAGFAKRCVWGYTRVLNALYQSIAGDSEVRLLRDDVSRRICEALDVERASPDLKQQEQVLATLQQNRKDDGQRNRVVKKAWINVFGFSRGAAEARVFVNKLMKEWAPDGKIVGSIPYEVNFVGLFDTVASVGPPDSVNSVIKSDKFDGHFAWARSGNLNIPAAVKRCVHFFSIHEQRMSFPLDTVRMGNSYPQNAARLLEVAYPGVHSDVGGGYAAGEQGKARLGDSDKLSRIPLHDMYIEALKAGVPLLLHDELARLKPLARDFAIAPDVAKAFNGWLDKVIPIRTVEDAMEFGMRQNLMWRTLRARIGTGSYLANQPFFAACRQDKLTPNQVEKEHKKVAKQDDVLQRLRREEQDLMRESGEIASEVESAGYRGDIKAMLAGSAQMRAVQAKLVAKRLEIQCREELLYAQVAGKKPEDARPGEGADEIVTNDQTDLLEGAEDFRLLLASLHPDQRDKWQASIKTISRPATLGQVAMGLPFGIAGPILTSTAGAMTNSGPHLCVLRQNRPASDSSLVALVKSDVRVMYAAIAAYTPEDDVVLEHAPEMGDYLRKWTSVAAVDQFAIQEKAAIKLFDDYIHDSRAWFRVPNFHEYAPGGYGWARTFFVGNDTRVRHLGIKMPGTLDAMRDVANAVEKKVRATRDATLDAVGDAAAKGVDAILDGAAAEGRRVLEKVLPTSFPIPRL